MRRGARRGRDRTPLQRPARGKAHPTDEPSRDDPRRRGLSADDRLPSEGPRSGQVSPRHDRGLRGAADADQRGLATGGSRRDPRRQLVAVRDARRSGRPLGAVHPFDHQRLGATGGVSAGRGLCACAGGARRRGDHRRRQPRRDPAAAIELVDCIARGEATFLRVEDLQPVRLFWNNGLLATSERLLVAVGGARSHRPANCCKSISAT